MNKIDTFSGRTALVVGHVAGMIDLVALPVWVGALIAHYAFAPPQAGGLATLFLVGAVIASLFLAPRFTRLSGRMMAPVGFAVAALAFLIMSQVSAYPVLAALHLVAGLSAGTGLSFTHGTMGRSANPHRLFAMAGLGLGVFAVIYLGATPVIVAGFGGPALFYVFAGVMAVAAIITALVFPAAAAAAPEAGLVHAKFNRATWLAIFGIMLMALNQAMIFSFVERIGIDRGFGQERVVSVLIVLGLINITPAILAAFLQNRLSATRVAMAGPVVQAALAIAISSSESFIGYALPTVFFAFVMIFTHTFVFGLIARLEPTGRALASTPAMLMVGAAIAPLLGGVLVETSGYPALGVAAVVFGAGAVVLFAMVGREARDATATA